jgi:hypothetical protein
MVPFNALLNYAFTTGVNFTINGCFVHKAKFLASSSHPELSAITSTSNSKSRRDSIMRISAFARLD